MAASRRSCGRFVQPAWGHAGPPLSAGRGPCRSTFVSRHGAMPDYLACIGGIRGVSGGAMGERYWWWRAWGWLAAAAVAAVALVLAGCATKDGGGKKPPGKGSAALVGRVASVPKGQDFVLLQAYGTWSVPPGTPVFSAGPDGRVANLLPSGERMGQFLAADLRDGRVEVGDGVYYRSDGSKPAKPEGGAPGSAGATAPNSPAGPGAGTPTAAPDAAADPAAGAAAEPELPQ